MKKTILTAICLAIIISAGISQTIDTLSVDIEHGNLEGTLIVPDSETKIPVALIIAGSGPTDRDGNNIMMKNNSLKMIAEGLAENGIASLRYDKRGVGKSRLTGVTESQVRFEDFIGDAGKWLDYLSEDERFGEITVIGHSEGSLIGMILSQNDRAGKFISIAGAGEPAGIIIRKQLKAQPPFILEQAEPILDKLEKGETVDSVPQMLYSLFRPEIQPYIISWFKYDPREEIAKLDKPVLIVQGTTDIQVSLEDAENLAKANPGAKKTIIGGMNHVLKEAEADRMKNMLTYSNPDLPLNKGLVEAMVRFIKSGSGHHTEDQSSPMAASSKPYARYWWFASDIKKEDVRYNLNWLKENGFGGVELAWVYPLNSRYKYLDSTYTPRQEWLSPEWKEIVDYTIQYADSIGLGCDLTLGTLWPFGDSRVTYEEASQTFGTDERQVISRSWEYPEKGYVVDHLNPDHYLKYFNRLLDSFPRPDINSGQAYFIDSWEVETEKLWTEGFGEEFQQLYGYDIVPYMESLYKKGNQARLYDYMKLISGKVIRFYSDFDKVLNNYGILSRGQCSGAPCDIISAYSKMDIPEGEAMLYEPEFNSIPASAAALSGKNVVTAETFTCLYGWPADYIREEQTADLKILADALFANGINQIIWHGKAHNPKDEDTVNFYASVHLGDKGALAPEIPAFNNYLTTVSDYMKKGEPYSDIAVYLPTEDAWIKGIMPKNKQFIWAWGYYEMRYVYFPDELKGYHPTWINSEFLNKGKIVNGELFVGNTSFSSLYIDVEFIDYDALKTIVDLAVKGLPIILKQTPMEPGTIIHEDWDKLISSLKSLPNVRTEIQPAQPALLSGKDLPPFRAREDDNGLYIFFANPGSAGLKFPVEYGQSYCETIEVMPLKINYGGNSYDIKLRFEPHQSLLYHINDGKIKQLDISFIPKTPVIKKRPAGFTAPWLVK